MPPNAGRDFFMLLVQMNMRTLMARLVLARGVTIGDLRCFGQLLCSMCLVFDHRRPGCGERLSRFRDRIPFQVVLEKSSSRRSHVWFLFVFPYFFAMGDLVTGSSVLVSRSFSRARIERLRKGECEGLLYMHVHGICLRVVVSVWCNAS